MIRREQLNRLIPPECREAHLAMEARLVNDGYLDAARDSALRAHLAECAECADFDRISRHFGELPPALTEIESRRMVHGARALHLQRQKRRRKVLWWSAAAAAAVLLLILYPMVFSASSSSENSGRKLAAGEHLHMFDSRMTLYSSMQSEIRTIFESRDTVHVRLDHGFMCANIEPDPNQRVFFRVVTPMANVDIKGTAFGVTVSDDAVEVEVVRGEVVVEPTGSNRPFFVTAGYAFDVGAQRTSRNDADSDRHIRALLGLPPAKKEASVAMENEIDTEREPIESSSSGETDNASEPASARPRGIRRAARPSLKTLLEEATQCRIEADWECAAKRYKKIITTYPRRGEVATALINLGQIQVKHLRQPLAARRNFEAYLTSRPSGPLSEQALYGIARANRTLGDRRGEQRTLERFLTRHPSSPMAASARQRLEELKK